MAERGMLLALLTVPILASCVAPDVGRTNSSTPHDPVPGKEATALPTVLTVDEAVDYAWSYHPAMIKAQHLIAAEHGREMQAGLWPRPELRLSAMDKQAEDEIGASVAQKLELGGKRRGRVSESVARVFLAETELVYRWTEIRAEIKGAFARLAYLRETSDLLDAVAEADNRISRLDRSLHELGKLSKIQVNTSLEDAALSRALAASQKARLADAERAIFTALGIPQTTQHVQVAAELIPATIPGEEFKELVAPAVTNSPALKTAKANALVAAATWRLAKTIRWMDLGVEATVKDISSSSDGGKSGSAAGVQLSLDLPLWNRGQGDIVHARESLDAARLAETIAELDTITAVSRLLAEYKSRHAEADAYENGIVPRVQERCRLIQSAFSNGRASKRDVLKVEQELLRIRIEYAQIRLLQVVSAIELEAITSVAVPPAARR